MMIGEVLMAAQAKLTPVSDSPRLDAELLLSHVTGYSRSHLLIHLRDPLAPKDSADFQELIARRATREPVAYLTGDKGFWTLNLKVSPAVLVPRPETELLVEWALDIVDLSFPQKRESSIRIADLGTGSGCIALALASELPRAQVLAVDISFDALEISRENAKANGIGNVVFLEASFAEALSGAPSSGASRHLLPEGEGKTIPSPSGRGAGVREQGFRNDRKLESFDLIVSNPPYIARNDAHLDALQHEPLIALTDGADGLQAIREIIASAQSCLRSGGWLLLEHGYDQGAAVRALFEQHGYAEIQTRRDLSDHERATGARKP